MLKRSADLEEALTNLFRLQMNTSSDRNKASRIMCSVAFEHAESLKLLIATGNCTSALGTLRLQYETFTRAMWLFYAASDTAVSKLMVELTTQSAKKSDRLPMLSEMLKKLEGKAPRVAYSQLLEFKKYHWKPLSSFVHGGIHAVQRHSEGYPVPLLTGVIKASNGLSIMVGMLLVITAAGAAQQELIPKIQKEYRDCCPPTDLSHYN